MATPIRTVVLGCAKQRRVDLGAVVEVLAGRGNAVEVVSGIETNPLPWEQAVQRIGTNAIYVVCGDDVLTLEKIAGLRAALQRGNVPLKQIWAGPINWAEPVQVLRHADQLLRTSNGTPTRSPSEASGRTVLPSPSVKGNIPSPPPIPMAALPKSPPPAAPPAMPEDPQEMQVAGNDNRKALLFGGAALVATAVLVTVIAWPTGEDASEVGDASAVAAAKAEAPEPKKEPVAEEKVVAVAEPEPEPEPEVELEPDPVPAAEPGVPATVKGAKTPAAAEAAPAPVVYATDEDVRIDDALRNQAIRALDILLIAPEAKVQKRRRLKTAWLRFPEAEVYCGKLTVDGVDGWRLPTAGELASLTTANLLLKSNYWSSTEGDTYGNTRIIWGVRHKRMRNASERHRGARTICVRDHV